MNLTGKNKENFEKWFTSDARFFAISCIAPRSNYDDAVLAAFEQLPFEMQIGVYIAYYNSLGYDIYPDACSCHKPSLYTFIIKNNESEFLYYSMDDVADFIEFSTPIESYKHAFKKADELINNFLK